MTILTQPVQARASKAPALSQSPRLESILYTYVRREHELVLTLRGVEEHESFAVAKGDAEFALLEESPLLMLCARFGDALPWMAAPFCWHHMPSAERVLPPSPGSEDESRIQLQIVLIEAEDGSIRASRCVTFTLDFTRSLNEAIREQARLSFNPREQERRLAHLNRRCPTPSAMVAYAAARTPGLC